MNYKLVLLYYDYKMDSLVDLLLTIQNIYDLEVKNGYITDRRDIIKMCLNLTENLLITPYGKCNWDNIELLKNSGFDIYPGEKDCYGWLTGCIKLKNGIIVFG